MFINSEMDPHTLTHPSAYSPSESQTLCSGACFQSLLSDSDSIHVKSTMHVTDRLKLRGLWAQVNMNLCKDTSPSSEIQEGRRIRAGGLNRFLDHSLQSLASFSSVLMRFPSLSIAERSTRVLGSALVLFLAGMSENV